MKLTLQTQLLPDATDAARLKATVERFNEAADWLAGFAFEHKVSNKIKLQQLAYRELRERFAISSQMRSAASPRSVKRTSGTRPSALGSANMPRSPTTSGSCRSRAPTGSAC
jgi:putative transposase